MEEKEINEMNNLSDFWLTTYTGKKFRLMNPEPEMIDLRDISRGLSRICRFAGQTERPYTVAEHSLQVGRLVPRNLRLLAILHDAPETYICDLPTPWKRLLISLGAPVEEIEQQILKAILQRFEVDYFDEDWDEVMKADQMMFAAEARQMIPTWKEWGMELPEPPQRIDFRYLGEEEARRQFEQTVMGLM